VQQGVAPGEIPDEVGRIGIVVEGGGVDEIDPVAVAVPEQGRIHDGHDHAPRAGTGSFDLRRGRRDVAGSGSPGRDDNRINIRLQLAVHIDLDDAVVSDGGMPTMSPVTVVVVNPWSYEQTA